MKKRKRQKGFTLIELIVVIAILGILAVIAIPRFTGMRQNANLEAIDANLLNIQKAVEVVAAQNNVEIDTINDTGTGEVATALGNWPHGPGNVEYSVVDGVATASAGSTGTTPPLPTSLPRDYDDID